MANTLPEITCQGFPGGPAVKNPPANAGDIGSILGPEGFHIPRGNKPMCRNNWARTSRQEKPQQWEACASQLEGSPHLLQLEKPHTVTKTQHTKK